MATVPLVNRRRTDRRLYLVAAILTPIIVLLGFGRTYYLKAFFDSPSIPGRLVHLHGLVMTSWVLLFVTQITLVAKRRVKLHQKLGIAGAFLAALVVIVGLLTAVSAAARGASPGPPALQFLIIPFGDMVAFASLITIALYYRRQPDIHKRVMLLAALNLLTPAIARIPLSFILNGGPLAFFGLTDLIILGVVAADTIKHKRLHPVFLWGTILVIAFQPLRLFLSQTGAWLYIAQSLVALVK